MDKNNYTIEEIKKAVEVFSEYDNIRGAYEYYKGLKKFVEETNLKHVDHKLYGSYYKYLIRLKFIALNFFDDWREMEELLKNHFEAIYRIKYYDLWNKIKLNLLTISDLNKRDEIKSGLKKILLDCNRVIIDKKKYKGVEGLPVTVAEWLKDFTVNLGIGKIDHLKKVQYLTNSENIKILDGEDKNRLKVLFDFYEKLKTSSNTPEGFEDDIPMVINGKYVMYSQGQVEDIGAKIQDLIKSIKIGDEVKQLQKMVSQYPAGSLERKAIEEEINKVKR